MEPVAARSQRGLVIGVPHHASKRRERNLGILLLRVGHLGCCDIRMRELNGLVISNDQVEEWVEAFIELRTGIIIPTHGVRNHGVAQLRMVP